MSVVVRFAPSPTGFLHIGGVHTALFNWLFARHEGGEFRLRIENTDTSREVAEATQQIQDSLGWLGLDRDGEVTFQLDRMERCRDEAARLVAEDKAYEDEGAIRMRMPDQGTTAWDDLIRVDVAAEGDAGHLQGAADLEVASAARLLLPEDARHIGSGGAGGEGERQDEQGCSSFLETPPRSSDRTR